MARAVGAKYYIVRFPVVYILVYEDTNIVGAAQDVSLFHPDDFSLLAMISSLQTVLFLLGPEIKEAGINNGDGRKIGITRYNG